MTVREVTHLNPAWQRGPVWSVPKQALLIDSILRGYDVPKIYLRECNPKTPFQFEVVDGQQRLRAIWSYIDDDYSLPASSEKVGRQAIAGKKFHDLPKKLQDTILNFPLIVAYIQNAKEPELSRLFSRMQMGVRLNPPELRNAVQSGMRHAIDSTARLHPFFLHSRIPSARYKHQDYLAHAVSLSLHKGTRDLKAQQLMEDYENIGDDSVYAPIIDKANEILNFLETVNEKCGKRIRQKWMFVDLFFLLFECKKGLNSINAKDFTDAYLSFDNRRLDHNSEPESLIAGKSTAADKDLYDYILAFKISGGEKRNVLQRQGVLKRHFKKVIGG